MGQTFIPRLAAVLAFCCIRSEAANVEAGDNAKYFDMLCRIYKVAKVSIRDIYPTEEISKIQATIDVINASLASLVWFDEVRKAENHDRVTEEFKKQYPRYTAFWTRWKSAVDQVSRDKKFSHIGSAPGLAEIERRKLGKIEEELDVIVSQMEKANTTAAINQINGEFAKVIFGDEGKESDAVYTGAANRAATCGVNSLNDKPGGAGKSLIMDFLCLCAKQTSNGLDKVCGEDVALGANNWDTVNSHAHGKAAWKVIESACSKRMNHKKPSIETAYAAMANFETEIAVGKIGTSTAKFGLIGNCHTSCSNGCTGEKDQSNKGICIYYKDKENIKWLSRLQSALDKWTEAQTQAKVIENDLTRLKMLQHRAEEIYEEARTASELEKYSNGQPAPDQNQKQKPNVSTDKATAQEPTSVNSAAIYRFILPWEFLI